MSGESMKAGESSFLQNQVLFGHNATPGIVAVDPIPGDKMRVFRREGARLTTEDRPFRPFLWVNEAALLAQFQSKHEIEKLKGNGFFRYLVWFNSWRDFLAARKHLSNATRLNPTDP